MPAYNFQFRFVTMILDGSKPHTIRRRRRKRPTKVGDMLWLYTGLRTKKCVLIASSPCIDVVPIIIFPWEHIIQAPAEKGLSRQFSNAEIDRLVLRDGFKYKSEFFDFFKRYRQEMLDDFEIVWWSVNQLDVNPLAPIALSGTSPKSKTDLGEEVPGVCSLGFDMRKD